MAAVSFKTNAISLAARQRIRGKAVSAAMQVQARLYGETLKRAAESLSQGPMTTAQLSQYKPGFYSTSRTGDVYSDAVINQQTGRLRNSWYSGVGTFSGHVTVTVWNTSPEAKFMLGTSKMRKRDILGRAIGQIKPFSTQMLQAKRQGEQSVGGSLALELVNVAITVGVAYGSAAM